MKMNENVSYVSPEVEVVKIAIEKGFAASGFNDDNYDGNSNGEQLPEF